MKIKSIKFITTEEMDLVKSEKILITSIFQELAKDIAHEILREFSITKEYRNSMDG
jgi:hypothetical protein